MWLTVEDALTREELQERIARLEREPSGAAAASRHALLVQMGRSTDVSEIELMDFAFESVVALTESEGGYFHFVSESAQTIDLVSWSRSVLAVCDAEKTQHYPIADAGIWADSVRRREPVIHNEFQSEPDRKGYPGGHFEVRRHLSVPVFDEGRVVAVVGVGNKTAAYTEDDVETVVRFMGSLWSIIRSKRAAGQFDADRWS